MQAFMTAKSQLYCPCFIHAANHLEIWNKYEVGIVHFAAGYLELQRQSLLFMIMGHSLGTARAINFNHLFGEVKIIPPEYEVDPVSSGATLDEGGEEH